ncbi:hypothetical protein [Bremerella sp.]|uniref:hypothetical protein n=1 Tax=Bremerella sp. TaxID=2795602 RepID=UPI00391C5E65
MGWTSWPEDTRQLSHDRCFFFFPFLRTAEGSIENSTHNDVPASEAFNLKTAFFSAVSWGLSIHRDMPGRPKFEDVEELSQHAIHRPNFVVKCSFMQ